MDARLNRIFTFALAAFALMGAVALAGSTSDPKHDVIAADQLPDGVKKSDVDIVRATTGKQDGKIVMTMKVDGSMKAAMSDPLSSPMFGVKAGSHYFAVQRGPDGYALMDFSDFEHPKPAKVTRTDSHTVQATFKPGEIGKPAHYDWYAVNGECVVFDRAPDTGYVKRPPAKRC